MTPSPFTQGMVVAQIPPGLGSTISCRGICFETDAEGRVELPRDVFEELRPHGLTAVQPGDAPKAKK